MGRSKEMGKPAGELTPDELRREQLRCQTMLTAFGHKAGAKELRKRLAQIQPRLSTLEKAD